MPVDAAKRRAAPPWEGKGEPCARTGSWSRRSISSKSADVGSLDLDAPQQQRSAAAAGFAAAVAVTPDVAVKAPVAAALRLLELPMDDEVALRALYL